MQELPLRSGALLSLAECGSWDVACYNKMAYWEILILAMFVRLVSQSEEKQHTGLRDLPLEDPVSTEK